jgi:drug/metabolite transporter (DMT)-like permease
MGVLLGLCVAAVFGSGDFLGGRSAQQASTLAVLGIVQAVAVAGAVVVAVAVAGEPTGPDVWLGVGAGAANVCGLGCLYQALATGRMSIVAPVAAVVGALVPVGWALVTGERPGSVVLAGVVVAVAAGPLIVSERDTAEATSSRLGPITLAIAGGLTLGTSLVFFAATDDESGFWPVLSARLASLALVGAALAGVVLSRRRIVVPRRRAAWAAVAAGACDVTAAMLLLVAVRQALTVVVAPVAALAPAFTVGWAMVVLRERLSRVQAVGLVVGVAGLVLIAAG